MVQSPLYELIQNIEYGTKLHIGVLFFGNYGNDMCELPKSQRIHSSNLCDFFKTRTKDSFEQCFKCKNIVLKKVIKSKKAFGGICTNGIYEYTYPVIIENEVACVIFIGNIATNEGLIKMSDPIKQLPLDTLEYNITQKKCERICKNIEYFILYLLEKYPKSNSNKKPIIKNIETYIENNLEFKINIEQIAAFFHYNPLYLGRLFKKETGDTLNNYISNRRLQKARHLLVHTTSSIIDVSTECGFNNVTYFNRLFKNLYGISPTKYRNENNH